MGNAEFDTDIPDVDLTPLDREIKALGRRIARKMEEVGYYHVKLPSGLLVANLKVDDFRRTVQAPLKPSTLFRLGFRGNLSETSLGVFALRPPGSQGGRTADVVGDFQSGVLGREEVADIDLVFTIDDALAVLRDQHAIWPDLDMWSSI